MLFAIVGLLILPLTLASIGRRQDEGATDPATDPSIVPLISSAGCQLNATAISLPQNQNTSALTIPEGQNPIAVALGMGVQNYTCTQFGNYTSVIYFPPPILSILISFLGPQEQWRHSSTLVV